MRQGADLVHPFIHRRLGDDDGVSGDVQGFGIVIELFEQPLLAGRKWMVEEAVDDFEISATFQHPGGATHIARRGAGVGKTACVFVNTQEKQCRLDRSDGDSPADDLFQQQCGGGPNRLTPVVVILG